MGDQNSGVILASDNDDSSRYSTDDGTISATTVSSATASAISKMKKNRDPNEPPKPVSAYALFFRDTQTAIKEQNPDASFGEVSKIVASMWDALDPEHKNVYKKKSELAKKEYLKSLAAYRASVSNKSEEIISVNNIDNSDTEQNQNNIITNSSSTSTIIHQTPTVTASPSVVNVLTLPRPSLQSSPQNTMTAVQQQQHIPNQPKIGGNNLLTHQQSTNNQQQQRIESSSDIVVNQYEQNEQQATNLVSEPTPQATQKCIREGCTNDATVNPDWEDEYCSNECVIIHCRDVFSQWVQSNNNVASDSFQTA